MYLRSLILIAVYLIVGISAFNIKVDFLFDFFKEENTRLNFITNWDANSLRDILSRNIQSKNPKIISFLDDTFDAAFNDYIIIDMECSDLLTFVKNIVKTGKLLRKRQLLIFENSLCINVTANINFTNGYNTIIYAKETDTGFTLLKHNDRSNLDYGKWDISEGLIMYKNKEKACNFHGKEFNIALVLSNPDSLNHLNDYSSPWIDAYTKQSFSTLSRLFDYCNITPRFIPLPNYEHFHNGNNSYLLTASTPYLTARVLEYVDVLYVQNGPKVCYLMKRPPTSFMTTIFTDALAASVWWATLAILGLLSLCYYFILNIEGGREKIKEQEKFSVIDLGLIALEAVCQQGTTVDPKTFSGRILAVVLFLALMFIYVSYSTNILILLQSTSEIPDSEKLHSLNIQFGGMYTENVLQYNYEKNLGDRIYSIDNTSLYSTMDGMDRLKNGYFAYYVESPYAYKYANEKYTEDDVCGIHEIGGYIEKKLNYISIPKNSPHVEVLKSALLLMVELGFQSRDYQRYFYKPRCYMRGSSFAPIGFTDTYQLAYLIAMGIVTSLSLLGIEFLIKRIAEKHRLKKAYIT